MRDDYVKYFSKYFGSTIEKPNQNLIDAIANYNSYLYIKDEPKISNEKKLESIPIEDIERFLRKKKLEKLKNQEE